MRNNITSIEIKIDPLDNAATIGCNYYRAYPYVAYHKNVKISLYRVSDVLQSLKTKGYDQPTITYTNKYYGFIMRYTIHTTLAKLIDITWKE